VSAVSAVSAVDGEGGGADVGVAPAARAARERLAEWWPGLA
jgi:hypothetical protein